jgi:hypothetical protein
MAVERKVGFCPHTGEPAVFEHHRCHCGATVHISINERGLRSRLAFTPLNLERDDEP